MPFVWTSITLEPDFVHRTGLEPLHAAAELPESQRPARLDRDLPKVQPALALDRAHHVILVAARGAARGQHDVVVSRRLAERARHDLGAIGQDAEIAD